MVSETKNSAVGVLTGTGVASVLHSLPNTGPSTSVHTYLQLLNMVSETEDSAVLAGIGVVSILHNLPNTTVGAHSARIKYSAPAFHLCYNAKKT